MTKLLTVAVLSLVLGIVIIVSVGEKKQTDTAFSSPANHSVNGQVSDHSSHVAQQSNRVPEYSEEVPDLSDLPPTLSPDLFTGNPKLAYQAAKEIPQTLAQLPCYCHCDMSKGHKSLHSCFVTDHGEACGICINEALMAYGLEKRHHLNPAQIRQRINAAYGVRDQEP
jgi:hypothetical protein